MKRATEEFISFKNKVDQLIKENFDKKKLIDIATILNDLKMLSPMGKPWNCSLLSVYSRQQLNLRKNEKIKNISKSVFLRLPENIYEKVLNQANGEKKDVQKVIIEILKNI